MFEIYPAVSVALFVDFQMFFKAHLSLKPTQNKWQG